ncbi:MAG: hypothetical protein HDT13_10970 [Butyrivibrio sp.]|nr:hypothetical protein [Butyrivibrio sp.]
MRKIKRSAAIFLGILMTLSLYTGCSKDNNSDSDTKINDVSYGKGVKKIYANLIKEYAIFTNVAFYDFISNKKISSHSGKVTLEASTYASTELYILAEDGNEYWLSTNVALNKFPSSFRLYTNYEKTAYDTYLKK